ncbi:helix-turn-helix transcriptional regulator [Peredibacter sp. HCB2-198]|uniref:helix-turn-helix transcriptional regulator n=1 Tax=Peredibacter sp. HCB2-198 TaxID=3383025 RepID=UPI0038B6A5A0
MKLLTKIGQSRKLSLGLITLFALWAMADVVREYYSGEEFSHLGFEFVVAILALIWSIHLWQENFKKSKKLTAMQSHIETLTQEAQDWKDQNSKLIEGLSQSIHNQMLQWGLTPAEQEVALLLLKGLSFKEIAEIRSTSEKTTRQQALIIYQKSHLPGRAELSAFFLEELLSPSKA